MTMISYHEESVNCPQGFQCNSPPERKKNNFYCNLFSVVLYKLFFTTSHLGSNIWCCPSVSVVHHLTKGSLQSRKDKKNEWKGFRTIPMNTWIGIMTNFWKNLYIYGRRIRSFLILFMINGIEISLNFLSFIFFDGFSSILHGFIMD